MCRYFLLCRRTQGEGSEDSRIIVSSDGQVKVFTGTMATGQGHETAWTQIVVEKLGVNPASLFAKPTASSPVQVT